MTILVTTDPLLESTDPQHQPGSMTVHHRAPSPKQGLVNDSQNDGQERGEQVDPQQIPAPNSDTGTSMHDIDEDDEEVQDHIQTPEIPPNWQPAPPSLSYISQELGNEVDTSSLGLATWRPDSPVFDADGLLVEGDRRDQSSQHNSQGRNVDASSRELIIPRSDSPVFDDQGLLVEGTHRDQSSQQLSRQGDPEEASTEDDVKIPALVPIGTGHRGNTDEMPRLIQQDPLGQNPYAALADNSDDEAPNEDISRPTNANGTEDQEPRTYASIASSSSGSGDAGDQPSFAKLTKLPTTGMRQRWTSTDAQSDKQDRTPKTKRTSKGQTVTTPSTMASIARKVCTKILSPIVGDQCVHKSSSEEVSPANSNDPELEESKTPEPDIEEGIRETNTGIRSVEESKSQETEINIQSSSSSSHQPPSSRTRLARSTSREREARLASENQVMTRSQSRSAERVNTPVTMPQTIQHNLTPNIRGRQRPSGRGRGRPKNNKRPDFR